MPQARSPGVERPEVPRGSGDGDLPRADWSEEQLTDLGVAPSLVPVIPALTTEDQLLGRDRGPLGSGGMPATIVTTTDEALREALEGEVLGR
jgi:hypothetical protein